MATVVIPLLLKDFTDGSRSAQVSGSTVSEIVAALDGLHPGIAGRIIENGQLSPTVAVTVDGRIAAAGIETAVGPDSEVRLLPSLGGG
jgi:molybdopterin synthase sulfur carrier subunit